jgi:hypothetical protein
MISRRHSVSTIGALTQIYASDLGAKSQNGSSEFRKIAFLRWLSTHQSAGGDGLLRYMHVAQNRTDGQKFSLVASADTAIWAFNQELDALALSISNGLLRWHSRLKSTANKNSKRAMPTEIQVSSPETWVGGTYFYASDNLMMIEVMSRAYLKTKKSEYAECALEVGAWLVETLFDGKRFGVWAKNYGAPMAFMRLDGAVLNTIHTNVEYLWLSALNRLHKISNDPIWNQMFVEAVGFYIDSQAPQGCWYDYFKPHTPNSVEGRWHWYRGGDKVIGDNNLRAALAAKKYGRDDQVVKFLKWLKPTKDGLLHGYLNPLNGEKSFVVGDRPYFDLVCTGLLAELHSQQKNIRLANQYRDTISAFQSKNGGWFWGLNEKSRRPINDEQATITGLWATGNCL